MQRESHSTSIIAIITKWSVRQKAIAKYIKFWVCNRSCCAVSSKGRRTVCVVFGHDSYTMFWYLLLYSTQMTFQDFVKRKGNEWGIFRIIKCFSSMRMAIYLSFCTVICHHMQSVADWNVLTRTRFQRLSQYVKFLAKSQSITKIRYRHLNEWQKVVFVYIFARLRLLFDKANRIRTNETVCEVERCAKYVDALGDALQRNVSLFYSIKIYREK